ncbi:LysE family translocator [Candidatus Puniceispirillum sp.]|nr:LysE family translocator [Candidatus Puniceispirillum sp.]
MFLLIENIYIEVSADTGVIAIMTINEWMLLLLACLAGAASPGPSLALLIRSVIIDGRAAGVIFSLAHGAGILMYACLVVTGLETILLNSPRTLFVLQVVGCIFLFWLAFKMIVGNRMGTPEGKDSQPQSKSSQPILKHALDGFLIVFLNPKIAVFFLAIFSQFLAEDQSIAIKAGMVSVAWLIDTGWYLFVTIIATLPALAVLIKGYKGQLELLSGYSLILICSGLVWRLF